MEGLLYYTLFLIYGAVQGLRDISVGSDTKTYAALFADGFSRLNIRATYEPGFVWYSLWFRSVLPDVHLYLLSIALITALLLAISGHLLFRGRYKFAFLAFLAVSPFIQQLMTNAIRQGVMFALLLVFMAVFATRWKNRLLSVIFSGISYFFHIPTILNAVTLLYKGNKNLLPLWVTLIVVSVFSGTYTSPLEQVFAGTKYVAYFRPDPYEHLRMGFRPDFLLFSLLILPVVALKGFGAYKPQTQYFINSYYLLNGIGFLMNNLAFASRFVTVSWALLPYVYALALADVSSTSNGRQIKFLLAGLYVMSSILLFFLLK